MTIGEDGSVMLSRLLSAEAVATLVTQPLGFSQGNASATRPISTLSPGLCMATVVRHGKSERENKS